MRWLYCSGFILRMAPWGDMEEEMRREGLLLYGLESGDPIADFHIIGFSLGYEMAYSNVLNMLDLAGLPLRSADRKGLTPLVVAGGTCCYNPEPLAPFIDFFVLGEGEEVTLEYIDIRVRHKLIQLYSRKFIVLRNHDIHAHISTAATFYFHQNLAKTSKYGRTQSSFDKNNKILDLFLISFDILYDIANIVQILSSRRP